MIASNLMMTNPEMFEKELENMMNYEANGSLEMSPLYPNMTLLDELAITYLNHRRDGKKILDVSLPPVTFVNDLIPVSSISRPGSPLKSCQGVLIHSTANRRRGANARANIKYTKSLNQRNSYHCAIDINECVSIIPFNEKTYSTGSTYYNENYISIEVCEDETEKESTTRNLTKNWVYAAQLTAFLIRNYAKVPPGKKGSDYIVTHASVNKTIKKTKICPQNMLLYDIPFSFTTFCHLVDLFFLP